MQLQGVYKVYFGEEEEEEEEEEEKKKRIEKAPAKVWFTTSVISSDSGEKRASSNLFSPDTVQFAQSM